MLLRTRATLCAFSGFPSRSITGSWNLVLAHFRVIKPLRLQRYDKKMTYANLYVIFS